MTDWMAGWRRADNQREKEEGCKKNENSIIANLLMSPSHAYLSLSLKKFGVGVPGRRNKLPEIQLNTYSTIELSGNKSHITSSSGCFSIIPGTLPTFLWLRGDCKKLMGLVDRLALAGAKIRTSNDFRNDTRRQRRRTTSADSKRERRKPPTTTAATGATGARSPFSPNSAFCYTSLNSAKRAGEVAVSRYEAPHTHRNQTRTFQDVVSYLAEKEANI